MLKNKVMLLGSTMEFYMEFKEVPWVSSILMVENQDEILKELEEIEDEGPDILILTASWLQEDHIVEVIKKLPKSMKVLIYEDKHFNALIQGHLEKQGVVFLDSMETTHIEKNLFKEQPKEEEKEKGKILKKVKSKEVKNEETDQKEEQPQTKKKEVETKKTFFSLLNRKKEKSPGKIVHLIGAEKTGKSILCAALGDLAALNKTKVAIIDMDNQQNAYFSSEADEWVSENDHMKSFRYNSYLKIYKWDQSTEDQETKKIEIANMFKDQYELILIDTKIEVNSDMIKEQVKIARGLLLLSDYVLLVQDYNYDSVLENESLIKELMNQGSINFNKWIIVLNKATEGFAFGANEMYKYFKELTEDPGQKGRKISGIIEVPLCYKACMESKWNGKTPIESRHVTKEFKEALEDILRAVKEEGV